MQLFARKAILEFQGFVSGFQQKNFQGELNIAIFFKILARQLQDVLKSKGWQDHALGKILAFWP